MSRSYLFVEVILFESKQVAKASGNHKTELQLSFGGRDVFRPQRRDLAGRVHHAIAIGTCRSESVREGGGPCQYDSPKAIAGNSHRCMQEP